MENLDRIKRKIAKLMNLAAGTSNEHEAKNAMIKAAKLMNKFHVSGDNAWDNTIVQVEKLFGVRKLAKSHEKKLFWAICASMGVYGLYRSCTKPHKEWIDGQQYLYGGTPCKFICVGHPSDIEICWYMFEVCLSQVQTQTKTYGEGKKLKRTQLNDYAMGLVYGLSARFKAMQETSNDVIGTGLVPVDTRREDAKFYYDENGGTSTSGKMTLRNSDFLQAGVKDAKEIRVNTAVGGETKTNKTLRLS